MLRSKYYVEYIGQQSGTLQGTKLTTTPQILRYLLYNIRTKGTRREAAKLSVKQLFIQFLNKMTIPSVEEHKAVEKFVKLHAQYRNLMRNNAKK